MPTAFERRKYAFAPFHRSKLYRPFKKCLHHRIAAEVAATAVAAEVSSPDGIELFDERLDKCRIVGENTVLEVALALTLRARAAAVRFAEPK